MSPLIWGNMVENTMIINQIFCKHSDEDTGGGIRGRKDKP